MDSSYPLGLVRSEKSESKSEAKTEAKSEARSEAKSEVLPGWSKLSFQALVAR